MEARTALHGVHISRKAVVSIVVLAAIVLIGAGANTVTTNSTTLRSASSSWGAGGRHFVATPSDTRTFVGTHVPTDRTQHASN